MAMHRATRLCLALFPALLAASAWAQSPPVSPEVLERAKRSMDCGSLENSVGPWDYRSRASSDRRAWDHNDNMKNHYQPAIASMQAGVYIVDVIRDIDFLLRVWPNHHLGLRARIQYEEAGGKLYGFRTVECYLERARRMAPDDVAVILIEANYFWKNKKDMERAREDYEEALKLQPDSMDVNYNAGLFYFAAGKFDRALEHAQFAYARGYPLPGLRRKLEEKGYWKEPAPKESTTLESKSQNP
jgi:tetratricopeptide (TPR) repeat protein